MTEVRILHNKACSTSRHAVETAAASSVLVEIVDYLRAPLDRDQLLTLIGQLTDDAPADLVRKDPFFTSLGLSAEDYTTPEAVADLLVEHPRLMQRPVLIRDGRAIIGRPKDQVPAFLR